MERGVLGSRDTVRSKTLLSYGVDEPKEAIVSLAVRGESAERN